MKSHVIIILVEVSWPSCPKRSNVLFAFLPQYLPRHLNNGLLSSRVTLTSWGVTLPVDGVKIKKPDGVDILLQQPASQPIATCWIG